MTEEHCHGPHCRCAPTDHGLTPPCAATFRLYAYRLPYWSNADMPRAPSVDQMAAVAQTAPIPLDYGPWTSMSADGRDFVASCLQRYENERIAVSEALNHPWIKRHLPRSQNGWR